MFIHDEKGLRYVCDICGRVHDYGEAETRSTEALLPKGWMRNGQKQFILTQGQLTKEGENPHGFGIQIELSVKRVIKDGDCSGVGRDLCDECRGNLLRAVDTFNVNLLKVAASRFGWIWKKVLRKSSISGGIINHVE